MKKRISLFLIFQFLWMMALPAYAVDYPPNVKIIKENNKYGLSDKKTGKILIPAKYDSMKKAGENAVNVTLNGKSGVLFNNNEIAVPVEYNSIIVEKIKYKGKKYWNFYGIDNTTGRIFSKITIDSPHKRYSKDNEIIAARDYNLKNETKYGFIKELGNDKYLTIPAQYDDYYFPDGTRDNTLISFLNYLIVKKNNKWGIIDHKGKTVVNFNYDKILTFDAYILEQSKDKKVVDFPVKDKFIAFKGNNIFVINSKGKVLYSEKKPDISELIKNDKSKNLLNDIYELNNRTSAIKFNNFPSKGIIPYVQNNKYGMIIVDDNGYKKIPAQYQNLRFPDENSVVFNILGISYAPLNQVWILKISKNKNSKSAWYQPITSDGDIGVDFACKLGIPDEQIVNKINTIFAEYYKEPVIVNNNVAFYRNAVVINNELIKPSNIHYDHKTIVNEKNVLIKSNQQKSIGDVAINNQNAKISKFPPYNYRQTGMQKTGEKVKFVVSIPFVVIAAPFVFLFFAFFAHR